MVEHKEIQRALLRSPGEFSALQVWTRAPGGPAASARLAAAEVLRRAPAHVDVLVGVAPALLGLEPGQGVLPWPGLPAARGDVLVQYAAPTREALLDAIHATAAQVAGALVLDDETFGGRLGIGREAFGYRDGLHPPSADHVRKVARIAHGPLEGASWVLAIRFQQASERFFSLSRPRQDAVFGRDRDGRLLEPAPPDSHVARQHAAGFSTRMIRRGFPFRSGGEDGLAFVAATNEPGVLAGALAAFFDGEAAPDALTRYTRGVGAGLFLAPPNPEWLENGPIDGTTVRRPA